MSQSRERPADTRSTSPEQTFLIDLREMTSYLPEEARFRINHTEDYATQAFRIAQAPNRDDGSSAVSHSIETAKILADFFMPEEALEMALLHDVPEDTQKTSTDLRKDLNYLPHISLVIDGVDRIGVVKQYDPQKHTELDSVQRDNELERRLYEGVTENPLAAIVRTAERLHNLRTIKAREAKHPESAQKTARETLTIYVPLLRSLHLDDLADEMIQRSLEVLYPERLDDLLKIIPSFSPKKRQEIADKVRDILGLKPAQAIFIRPPNLENLLEYFDQKMPAKILAAQVDLPFSLDIHIGESSDGFEYLSTLRDIDTKDFHMFAIPGGEPIVSGNLESPPSLSLKLSFPETGSDHPLNVNVRFLTDQEWIKKTANVLHQFRTGAYTHPKYIEESRRLLTTVQQRLQRVKKEEFPGARGATIFTGELENNLMDVVATVNGIKRIGRVPAGSNLLDAASFILDFRELLRLDSISMTKDGPNLSFAYTPYPGSNIFIKTDPDPERIHATPFWVHQLGTAESQIKIRLIQLLRQIIDGQYEGKTTKTTEEIIAEAIRIGEDLMKISYPMVADGRPYPRLSILRALTPELVEKYKNSIDQFKIAVGIGEIPERTMEEISKRLYNVYTHFPKIRILIPKDRPGWTKRIAEIMTDLRLNIVEGISGETLNSQYPADIRLLVEPVDELTTEGLRQLLQNAVNECAKPKRVGLFGQLSGQQVSAEFFIPGPEEQKVILAPQIPEKKKKM